MPNRFLKKQPCYLKRKNRRQSCRNGGKTPTFGWDKFGRRSQDLPGRYVLNGSVYAARGDHVAAGGELVTRGTRILDMSPLRSIDIDTQDDLLLATAIESLGEGGATREGER